METPEGWNPMDEAPKDRPILILHNAESDPYQLEDGEELTPYGCYAEIWSQPEDGPYVAVWQDSEHEWDEISGRMLDYPGWWFVRDKALETPVAPVGWLPIPGFTRSVFDQCPSCKSTGFLKSDRRPDSCHFCANPDVD